MVCFDTIVSLLIHIQLIKTTLRDIFNFEMFGFLYCIVKVSDRDSVSADTQNQMTQTRNWGKKRDQDIPTRNRNMPQMVLFTSDSSKNQTQICNMIKFLLDCHFVDF